MKRVVITGTGIVSCIGNDSESVTASLREGRSGIRAMPQFAELGLRSQVAGVPTIDLEALIDRKQLRFMGDAAAYAHVALKDAIAQAGLHRSRSRIPAPASSWAREAARLPTRSRRQTRCGSVASVAWARTR